MAEKISKNFLEFVNKKNKKKEVSDDEQEDLAYEKPVVPISDEKVYIYDVNINLT
jgi:hypothetical protein